MPRFPAVTDCRTRPVLPCFCGSWALHECNGCDKLSVRLSHRCGIATGRGIGSRRQTPCSFRGDRVRTGFAVRCNRAASPAGSSLRFGPDRIWGPSGVWRCRMPATSATDAGWTEEEGRASSARLDGQVHPGTRRRRTARLQESHPSRTQKPTQPPGHPRSRYHQITPCLAIFCCFHGPSVGLRLCFDHFCHAQVLDEGKAKVKI